MASCQKRSSCNSCQRSSIDSMQIGTNNLSVANWGTPFPIGLRNKSLRRNRGGRLITIGKGAWSRPDDTFGLAGAVNDISAGLQSEAAVPSKPAGAGAQACAMPRGGGRGAGLSGARGRRSATAVGRTWRRPAPLLPARAFGSGVISYKLPGSLRGYGEIVVAPQPWHRQRRFRIAEECSARDAGPRV